MLFSQYTHESDERIIELIREGKSELTDILLDRYKNEVKKRSNGLTLMGADRDDLIQEGMIGLFNSIRDYKADKDCSFATFASICIRGAMVNAVLHYQSKKYGPLNSSLSFSATTDSGKDNVFEEFYGDTSAANPEKMTLDVESVQELLAKIRECLSKTELQVFEYCQQGLSSREIAEEMNISSKSVANSLTRIKQKIRKLI